MNVVPALLLFWVWLPSSGAACTTAYGGKIHYCKTFQTDYIEGMEILIFEERDVGCINSTVLSSPNLKSVLSLTLKGSKIHTIESGAFQQFKGLDILELQNNRLTTLSPSWFHDPGTLKNLTMANNSIGHLHPKMLDGFSNLEWLNLSLNQITSIHIESFRSLSKMVSLDLSYNKISLLRWQTLSPLNGTLRLGGNPWNCSCAHKDFILFLKELLNASRLTDPISVTCHYPPDLMGALMWNLTEMNCSLHAPPPLPEAVFYKVVLPVLFIVLALFVFILLIFLLWKKKQDQKQVRPDKRMKEVAGVRFPRTFGDGVAVNTNLVGFKITSSQYPAALGRTKSAAAILLQAEFNSSNVTQNQKRSEKSQAANAVKDCCNPKETSEGDMEMWYYDNLQCKVYHTFNANSSNMEDASTRPPLVSIGPVESDDYSTRSTANIDEPLVYLCINTAREESTMTIPVKKTRPPYKPRIIRRALSWPNVQCKKESRISYEDFLKTLKPGGSCTTQEKNKRVDSGDLLNSTQVLRPNQGLLRKVAIKNNSSLDGSPKNKVADDKFRQGNITRNVHQRSGKGGRAPRSKVVTPDSEVNRDGLPSQGSDARSELRSTPDDEQLLENNEYSFIDLLHEVVQNHGRWTRERWKQTHQQRMSSRTLPHP